YVFAASVEARNWKKASSPGGTFPPVQVTFCTTVSSPVPVVCSCRFQPAAGAKESIEKPLGGVSSTCVVKAFSFSVGTASAKTCAFLASTTAGLTFACANADPAKTRPTPVTPSKIATRVLTRKSVIDGSPFSSCERRQEKAGGARGAPAPADQSAWRTSGNAPETNGGLGNARGGSSRSNANVRRIQTAMCPAAAMSAAAANDKPVSIGSRSRWSGPNTHRRPCQPSPARQCRYASTNPPANEVTTASTSAALTA